MNKLEIKQLEELALKLEEVDKNNPLVLCDGKEEKYAVIPMEFFEELMELRMMDMQNDPMKYMKTPEIRVVNQGDFSFTNEEYEDIKKQLLEALEKTIKPKSDKLN